MKFDRTIPDNKLDNTTCKNAQQQKKTCKLLKNLSLKT